MFRFPTPLDAAKGCGDRIFTLLQQALAARPTAALAVSGGSTPKLMFRYMAEQPFDWHRVHLFWVDERGVPPDDPQSNYGMTDHSFIKPARFPQQNIHRIHGELDPHAAAERYVADILAFFDCGARQRPCFDVIQQGVGPDCHTASLFPGEALIDDRERIAAAVYVPKLSQWRITLLPGVLLAARHTLVLATGAEKAEAVRAVFRDPYDPIARPAQLITDGARSVAWFLDEEATRLLG